MGPSCCGSRSRVGNGEPLAEDGAVLTPRSSGLLGCVQPQGHDCRDPVPRCLQQLRVLCSGCSPPHARSRSMCVSAFKTSCLIARPYRLLFTSHSGGTFHAPPFLSPRRPPLLGGHHKPRVVRLLRAPLCTARDPHTHVYQLPLGVPMSSWRVSLDIVSWGDRSILLPIFNRTSLNMKANDSKL